jgi:formate hydrogenlyase subunit 6/NADH:ubiquinone oxidoreductase subunit I
VQAIQGNRKELHHLDVSKCIKCHSCVSVCARNAIIGIPISDGLEALVSSEVMQ